jgi:hypothetical protein
MANTKLIKILTTLVILRITKVIIIIMHLLSQAFSPEHLFSWISGDPHHSALNFQPALLSVLGVTFQVQLSCL